MKISSYLIGVPKFLWFHSANGVKIKFLKGSLISYLAPLKLNYSGLSKLKISSLFAILLSAFLVFRWFYYINTYSVNLMFWDQWGFYSIVFENGSLWDMFTYQHGPHRQGLGFILTKFLDDWSAWNTRTICFAIGGLILFSSFLALWLKKRLFQSINALDVVLVLICLSPVQYGLFTYTPNISHGAMPMFLLMLYCLCWTIKGCWKLIPIVLLNFILIFTGFGLFVGLLTPFLFLIDLLRTKEKVSFEKLYIFLAIVISLLSLIYFFTDYKDSSAKPEFIWSVQSLLDFGKFIVASVANYWSFQNLHFIQLSIAALSLLVLIVVFIQNLRCLWRNPNDPNSRLIVILIGFSLLFLLGMSIGRFSYGIGGSGASRYAIYLSPAFIGLYLHLCNRSIGSIAKFLFLLVFLYPNIHVTHLENKMEKISSGKRRWVKIYLENEDWKKTTQQTGFKIHPKPNKVQLESRLNYLKKESLNLYSQQNGE